MHDNVPQAYSYPEPPSRPVAWVTWFVVGTTVAVFVAQLIGLYFTGDDVVGDAISFSADASRHHRYWTLVTYAWAHAVPAGTDSWLRWLFWLHIVSNMIPIICLGPALEEMFGHARYLGLYLGGAIAAGLTWYAARCYFGPGGDPDEGIIGASGAVFAVIAAIGTAAPRVPVMVLLFFFVPVKMTMRVLAFAIVGSEAVQAYFHWMPEIAHSAHLGGAAFGFLYTLAIRRRIPMEDRF